MKKIIILILCLSFIYIACTKIDGYQTENPSLTSKGSVDYTNTNPTWIQVTAPILLESKWSAYFVAVGYTAGIPAPSYSSTQGMVTLPSTTFVVKWHIHVGLRNFNSLLKPDVIDYYYYNVDAKEVKKKPMPNGGVMGDYDISDTLTLTSVGYYNGYFLPYNMGIGYNWDGVSPTIHSSATNGKLYSAFFVGTIQ